MRILHTADWHIGQRLHERSRLDEHEQFLDWLLETIQRRKVDLLLVSGDIFDTALPSSDSTNLYYQFLYRLYDETDAYAVITAGNHDSPRHLEAPFHPTTHKLLLLLFHTFPKQSCRMSLMKRR